MPQAEILPTMEQKLIHVAVTGDSIGVRHLLQAGISPDESDAYGETALTWAAHLGHTDVVKDLLAAGADRDVRGRMFNATPLLLAARGGHRGIVALLAVLSRLDTHDKRGATAIMLAIEQPEGMIKPQRRILGILETLIQSGADLNLRDYQGDTALIWAVRWKNLEAARLLLSAGADPSIKNDAGQTALQIADESGYTDFVKVLQKMGINE